MSFSKARIQRFNELASEAPPPGAYDPKFDGKLKGRVFEKKISKNNDAKSQASSGAECNLSVSSRGTSNSASVKQFRTPQVPKKRAVIKSNGTSCPRAKVKLYEVSKTSQIAYEPQHELADLKVECSNKDKTINEHEKLIEDLKFELQEINEKFENLQEKNSQIKDQSQRDIESMAKLQQQVIENKNEKHRTELLALKTQLESALNDKEEEIKQKMKIEHELRSKVHSLEKEMCKCQQQNQIVDKMKKLELVTKKLDIMTGELNEALNLKNLEITDVLKLQIEAEHKLDQVQSELKKSEKQIVDLEANLQSISTDINAGIPMLNKQSLDEITAVIQEYFDYDNYDGKCNIEDKSFDPYVEEFIKKIKQFVIDFKLTCEREIELSRDNFNEERENLEQELERKRNLIVDLENKLLETSETNNFLTEELQDVQKLYKEVNRNLNEVKEELDVANEKYSKAIQAHKDEVELMNKIHSEEQSKLRDLLEEARREYLKELDNMTTARNEELTEVKQAMEKRIEDEKKRIKDCANKMVENAEAVTRETLKACRAESEERVRRVIAETDAKINLIMRETKNNCDEQLRQASEKYSASLSQLENEKTELSTTLAQRDLEVIRLTAALEEMKCTAETQESFSQSLQAELDRAEAELVEKKEELRNLKDQIRTESAEMVARRRRLEVVMAENQASVAALTRRLAQSDAEVEKLQRELQDKEEILVGYHDMLDNITHNSKMVQQQIESINDKIDEKVELINQIETKNTSEINAVKCTLNVELDKFKSLTLKKLAKVQQECKEKEEQNRQLLTSMKLMSERLSEATNMLIKMEEVNDEKFIELSKLELQNTKMQQELFNKTQIMDNFDKELSQSKVEINQLNGEVTYLKKDLEVTEKKLKELQEEKCNYNELQLQNKDQLQALIQNLSKEKEQREKLQSQIVEYEETYQHLSDESNQLKQKHVDYNCKTSHINYKQKLKQVSQLKEKINIQQVELLQLRQDLDTKSNLVDELREANEKLKIEARRQVGLGKENIHTVSSPHKSLFSKSSNSTPVPSPHKPHTPLRDRND